MDHKVLMFDDRLPRMSLLRISPRVCNVLKHKINYFKDKDILLMNRDLIQVAKQFKPDLLLVDKGTDIVFGTIEKINTLGVITANWFSDNLDHLDWMKKAIKTYKYFFHFDSYVVSLLKESGADNVYHIPFGCDIELHKTIILSEEDRKKYECDVCFAGAYTPERENLLLNLTDFNLKIYGYRNWQSSKLRSFYQGTITNDIELTKLYNSCKIAINYHYKYTGDGANVRTFEIVGCGGALQIVDYRKDILRFFEENKEIVVFKNVKELKEKVKYYLENEEERQAITKRCQEKAYKEHTLDKRMANLMEIIKRKEGL